MSRFSRKPTTRDEIENEIQNLMAALDDLKQDATRESRSRFNSLRARAESLWNDADLDTHRRDLTLRGREASRMAKDCAREHPLSTVALAAGAVALIGYLVTRR
ncbi:glycine zipper domain-containing protein [Stutzerimonas zhaodongensis]|uniref:glycine zipper domain-containing protein n=1 Tax=Stutzerimonas TaxID=2901164 RepID=UPI003890CBA0